MRLLTRVVFMIALGLILVSPALAHKPAHQPVVIVAGVYENFTVGKGSGDLEGMRVVIVPAGGGYYAIVQIAQGGAEDPKPQFVEAEVKGRAVSFTVGEEKFSGTVNAGGLTLKDSAGQSQTLKRKACGAYFR